MSVAYHGLGPPKRLRLGGREVGEADHVSSIQWNGGSTVVLEGKIPKAYVGSHTCCVMLGD